MKKPLYLHVEMKSAECKYSAIDNNMRSWLTMCRKPKAVYERIWKCLTAETGASTSPIVDRIKRFQDRRRGKKSYSQNRHPKSTRNIQIGWKHKNKKGFVLVSAGKGGKYHVDIEKNTTLEMLERIITDKYFPEGKNSISNLSLLDLNCFIATFTGKPLPSTLTKGDDFTLGGFLGENPSSPIRLYLHTQLQRRNIQTPRDTGGPSSQEPSQGTSSGHRYMLTCQDAANLIEISDSDSHGEEMEMAIAASLVDNRNECRQQTDENLAQLLEDFYERNINQTERQNILVYRRRVLDSAFRAISRPSFKPNAKLNIKFCEGEMAQDYGGPKREFLRLAIDELAKSNMFTGLNDDKILQHSVENLEKGSYKLAGMIVALSYVHDGAGPHFLNKHLFEMMTELPLNNLSSFNVATLNVEERQVLEKLQAAENHSTREHFLQQYGDWLIDQGFSNPYSLKIEDKDQLFTRIIKQLVLYRQSSEILQFKQGMNEICGFWEFVRQHAYTFMPSFCNPPTKLTKDSFLALCKTKFAEEGSNRRRQEEDTQYAWELFLLDIEEKDVDATFAELPVFKTGADKVPCRGFHQQISINFYDMEDGEKRYPFTSTCSLELYLPRNIQDPEIFRDLMMTSLRESYGFGKI